MPGVFELGFAFNIWALGRRAVASARISPRDASRPGFDLLRALGFSQREIDEANAVICGSMTVEGAPFLKEHYRSSIAPKVWQEREALHPPHGPHPDDERGAEVPLRRDLQDDQHAERGDGGGLLGAYEQSWRHGIKAMALYRDGSKLTQPLQSHLDRRRAGRGRRDRGASSRSRRRRAPRALAEKIVEKVVERNVVMRERERMPDRRKGFTQEAGSPATRSNCAPANTRMARSARSSSTCTRRARRCAR